MPKNCVFIHVPRTGGSSIWHSLVALASLQGRRGICDIYHETRLTFGSPTRGGEIVAEVRERVGDMPCLFHHHTDEAILGCFDPDASILATVLRDPVDRFVSEVFHSRAFLRSCKEPEFVKFHERAWGRRYVRALLSDTISNRKLLDIAASVRFFHNYYTKYFTNLLGLNQSLRGLAIRSSGDYLDHLFETIQSRIAVITRYESIQSAHSAIVAAFGVGDGSEPLERAINVSAVTRNAPTDDRSRYRRLFRSDYELIRRLFEGESSVRVSSLPVTTRLAA